MTDDQYFGRLGQAKPLLYKTAFMYLGSESAAVDAVDEAAYKGWRGRKKLRQPEYFSTWITRILINVCNDALRRRLRELPMENLPQQAAEDYDSLPLADAVSRLPEELRQVVVLRYFSGLTLEETARALGLPRGTVTSRQKRALALLRLQLEDDEQ